MLRFGVFSNAEPDEPMRYIGTHADDFTDVKSVMMTLELTQELDIDHGLAFAISHKYFLQTIGRVSYILQPHAPSMRSRCTHTSGIFTPNLASPFSFVTRQT
jgi:hypothetical protein